MKDDAEAWFRGEGYFHLVLADARSDSDERVRWDGYMGRWLDWVGSILGEGSTP